jgi:hypothetical protein
MPNGGAADSPAPLLEILKALFLVIGTMLLWGLVLGLRLLQRVPNKSAEGGYIALVSVVVAILFGLPWTEAYNELARRAGGNDDLAKKVVDRVQRLGRSVQKRLPSAIYERLDRGSLGLWVPFLINLGSVGWLIYFSGGLARSPFGPVPAIMFTLVVLLIDPPSQVEAGTGEAPEVASLDIGRRRSLASRPFLVLTVAAIVFYVAIIIIGEQWPYTVAVHGMSMPVPVDQVATLTIALSVAVVGIALAAFARVSIARARSSTQTTVGS